MAQKVSVTLVSDLSGEEIKDGKGETVQFTLDGVTHELDMTSKEADKFRALFQDYIAASRKVSGRGKRSSSTGTKHSKEELSNIRSWAAQNGYSVSERGRIKQDIMDAYHAAK